MEQILYAGNWELDLRFPGKKAGVAIFLLLSLCLLGVNAHSFSMHRTSRSSGGEGTSVYGKEPVYEEEGISDIRKDLITQIKMDRAGFDLTSPAGESTSGAGENLEVARKEVKRVDDKMTAASESLGGVIPNTGTTDTADIIPVSVQVHYYGNGGIPEETVINYETMSAVGADAPTPQRLGKVFDGWYLDAECTVPFTGTLSDNSGGFLYAGWKDLEYFRCNEQGIITACVGEGAVRDGLLLLPSESCCIGIGAGAFSGMEDQITDVYIPANITEIDPFAFADLYNLMYIEVEPGNPCYYSQGGILYRTDGEVAAYPIWYLQAE